MPQYEYECSSCMGRFERRQGIQEEPLRRCPDCGGPLRRVLHPVGVVFKGSGFYATDNRRDGGNDSKPKSDTTPSEKPAKETTSGISGTS